MDEHGGVNRFSEPAIHSRWTLFEIELAGRVAAVQLSRQTVQQKLTICLQGAEERFGLCGQPCCQLQPQQPQSNTVGFEPIKHPAGELIVLAIGRSMVFGAGFP